MLRDVSKVGAGKSLWEGESCEVGQESLAHRWLPDAVCSVRGDFPERIWQLAVAGLGLAPVCHITARHHGLWCSPWKPENLASGLRFEALFFTIHESC